MSKRNTKQMPMFPGGEDLPLFSGACMRGQVSEFRPQEEHRQPSLFGCAMCDGTGIAGELFCVCPAGQARREAIRGRREDLRDRLHDLGYSSPLWSHDLPAGIVFIVHLPHTREPAYALVRFEGGPIHYALNGAGPWKDLLPKRV